MPNSWRTYFDRCWGEVYPELPLPYNDSSYETVLRMRHVREYAEAKASKWQLFKRRRDVILYKVSFRRW